MIESSLLGLGAVLYWLGFFLGPALGGVVSSGPVAALSQALTSTTNLTTAVALIYLLLAVVTVLGLYAVAYNLRLASPNPTEPK